MPASPKPPRTPPKPKRPIRRKTPLPRATNTITRRVRPRPISQRRKDEIHLRATVTRPGVLKRDGYRCRACGWKPSGITGGWTQRMAWLEVHEEPPRSLGGDPNDPKDCITMCQTINGDGCHSKATRHELTIRKGPEGCNAPVTFTEGARSWQG